VVLFSIVDAHERRKAMTNAQSNKKEPDQRALGTLLGTYERDFVNVTNCFTVPITIEPDSNEPPKMDVKHNNDMIRTIQKALPNEGVVGWFSTDEQIANPEFNIHDYYLSLVNKNKLTRDTLPVVFLTVDCRLGKDKLQPRAYIKTSSGIPGTASPHTAIFHRLRVDVSGYRMENVALDTIYRGLDNTKREVRLSDGVSELRTTLAEMIVWVRQITDYIDMVLAGKKQPDAVLGRQLIEALGQGKFTSKHLDKIITNSMRDHLMVSYLAQVAKTQLALYEKMVVTV